MAPDRGRISSSSTSYQPIPTESQPEPDTPSHPPAPATSLARRYSTASELAARGSTPQNFTFRGVVVGTLIGIIICFSNTYFGLQTGWVSGMAMPSALIGFAYFRAVSRVLSYPFTPVENVLVQTVAGSVGTMPLGCGFVGVIPALNYLLTPEENGPLRIGLWKLIVWAIGICFFGVVFAVPLRKEVIIREKLKFPSGTATALMIGVLHREKVDAGTIQQDSDEFPVPNGGDEEETELLEPSTGPGNATQEQPLLQPYRARAQEEQGSGLDKESDWRAEIRLLLIAFLVSAVYTLASYFVPQLRDVPFLGLTLAEKWLWTLNPSPAYVGQGIIMGPATTLHMLLGAIVGWGILSPLAKNKGWAAGPVDDWEKGSKGWIVWVSLAIMLADSIVSLSWLVLRPLIFYLRDLLPVLREQYDDHTWRELLTLNIRNRRGYSALRSASEASIPIKRTKSSASSGPEFDAPPEQQISNRTTAIGLVLSLSLCIASVHYSFSGLISFPLTLLALILALLLSIMGVRALGETDLNPVSGISKITQLLFAFAVPTGNKNAVVVNLLAGALSESGALQAGDLMQDLKAGHLVGAAPSAQFYGQIIGSAVGAVASAVVYRLYTRVYEIPGGLFQVPTGYVWVFTARLVTGRGLPPMVGEWALGAGAIFAIGTACRVWGNAGGAERQWTRWIPGGIAVAVGMYNVPSFTMARAVGGLLSWYWQSYRGKSETPIIVLASGLILGEGVISIVNLLLASLQVPHL